MSDLSKVVKRLMVEDGLSRAQANRIAKRRLAMGETPDETDENVSSKTSHDETPAAENVSHETKTSHPPKMSHETETEPWEVIRDEYAAAGRMAPASGLPHERRYFELLAMQRGVVPEGYSGFSPTEYDGKWQFEDRPLVYSEPRTTSPHPTTAGMRHEVDSLPEFGSNRATGPLNKVLTKKKGDRRVQEVTTAAKELPPVPPAEITEGEFEEKDELV
jgi:hypothetical protein